MKLLEDTATGTQNIAFCVGGKKKKKKKDTTPKKSPHPPTPGQTHGALLAAETAYALPTPLLQILQALTV